jgi:hypothetical protein
LEGEYEVIKEREVVVDIDALQAGGISFWDAGAHAIGDCRRSGAYGRQD